MLLASYTLRVTDAYSHDYSHVSDVIMHMHGDQ
jgi:hypothetical protein